MRETAWFFAGGFLGMLGMAALFVGALLDRRKGGWSRIAVALQAERASRCERGQHREVLATKTPHMYLWCQDCDWREEVGIASQTGTNRKSRGAA